MNFLQANVNEYKKQLDKGMIQKAYKGILEYLMALRTHFEKQHPEFLVPGGLYTGYMDMSYFSIISPVMKERKLKIAVVFIHETCRFEVWLAGVNKSVQTEYWNMIKDCAWNKYPLVATTQGADAIIEHVLVDQPDFEDMDNLTKTIEQETLKFITDLDDFLTTM